MAPKTILVTGGAGFIGSHLVEYALNKGYYVRAIDNFSAYGSKRRWDDLLRTIPHPHLLTFEEGDIRDAPHIRRMMQGVDSVLHQAALTSIPESLCHPVEYHDVNVNGFLNVLESARLEKVESIIYASSSAVYGESSQINSENDYPYPISPYAAQKLSNEIYAQVFTESYGLKTYGLRYFNVYGPRQYPSGGAVIPTWISSYLQNKNLILFGNPEICRDFIYVNDVVAHNFTILSQHHHLPNWAVYNSALGQPICLKTLFQVLQSIIPELSEKNLIHEQTRPGDIFSSRASVNKITEALGNLSSTSLFEGLHQTIQWFCANTL